MCSSVVPCEGKSISKYSSQEVTKLVMFSQFFSAQASEQGNVMGLVSIYIIIYII